MKIVNSGKFSVAELIKAGYTAEEFKKAGFKIKNLVRKINTSGPQASYIKYENLFSSEELEKAGFTAEDFKKRRI
jgi:ribosomal protein L13E